MQTNNDPDTEDIYALPLDPAQPDHYRFEGTSHPLLRVDVAVDALGVRLVAGMADATSLTPNATGSFPRPDYGPAATFVPHFCHTFVLTAPAPRLCFALQRRTRVVGP